MSSKLRVTCAAALIAATVSGVASSASAGGPDQREWIRQFGTRTSDRAWDVATGADGRVHVIGDTQGHFGAAKGDSDILIITFDADGKELWRRQPGTSGIDFGNAVTTDADGNVYIAGGSSGSFGGPNAGIYDAFVAKFDRDGRILWRRQTGTADYDWANDVAIDPDGNVYAVGNTYGPLGGAYKGAGDAFIIKFDRDGHILWQRQPGTALLDEADAVTIDAAGNVYVTGDSKGSLGGPNRGRYDAFIIKFDRDGRILWKRQPGTATDDGANGIATDADGNVFVAGYTLGWLGGASAGDVDIFVIKLDGDGHILWKRQLGTAAHDSSRSAASDAHGNVYITGQTEGAFGGAHHGQTDAFVIQLDGDGRTIWSKQPGTAETETGESLATDANGNVYMVGTSMGALGGPNAGKSDAFVIKYRSGGPQ